LEMLTVDLGERSYPIMIGSGILRQPVLMPYIHGNSVMVVTNETVAPLYLQQLMTTLEGVKSDAVVLPDGEQFKNLATVNLIFDELLSARHDRTTTLIALGGGVVGDMAGFAAACYQRGVDFIQIPTTLLAQVDSSVGGKTGVNHSLGKNMIGAFYQPNAVLIDVESLLTLPARELSAGMAEVIKYGLIRDAGFLQWLNQSIDDILALQADSLYHAISRSCQIKADIVASDEREQGVRAILNLGHTFGHAIEAHTQYHGWLHGEAVAVGMLMAADLSVRMNWLTKSHTEELRSLLKRAGLPLVPPTGMSPADFIKYMSVDKKVVDGKIRLVIMKAPGEAIVSDNYSQGLLQQTLASFTQ